MKNSIQAVIIGFAHMHVNEIALYLSEQPDTRLIGCADVELELKELSTSRYTRAWNIQNVCDTYKVQFYTDYEAMLDTLKPDIAYILTDNGSKPAVVEQCARRGINVCIEKPMAVSLAEALKIRDIVERYGIEAVVNWPVIWRPYVLQMKQALDSGIAGSLIKLGYLNGHTGPLGAGARHRGVTGTAESLTDTERSHAWWYNQKYGGGAFLDIGCYGCMYSRWFQKDEALAVQALAMNLNTPCSDGEDNVAFLIRYPHSLTIGEGTWTTPQAAVPAGPVAYCTGGVIYCVKENDVPQVRAIDMYGNPLALPEMAANADMRNMAWHYAAHRLKGEPLHPTVTLAQNVDVLCLLDTAIRSAKSGKEELVPCVK